MVTAMHDVIVIGAGPAGLSAALHAKANGLDVLVIEKGELGNTVFDYQKKKHVMSEPAVVPLRSDLPFQAGSRESILAGWEKAVAVSSLPVNRPETVQGIKKSDGVFTIQTDKGAYTSRHVIVAIGIQGNPRRLNVSGENLPHVSSRLPDPFIYEDEDILMVGAGDAAIEGVLVLCEKNRVAVVNRNQEFYRLKTALELEINRKVAAGQVTAYHNAAVERIEEGFTYLKQPDRTVKVKANLVFVRIGAELPRPFLEKIGVTFGSPDRSAPPILSEHFESAVPGLYVIGAAAGYNLIKQGMNQGHDVVEHLLGHEVESVVEPLIREKLKALPGTSQERLAWILQTVPLLSKVPVQALRDLILESTVHEVSPGTVIFREHDFTDSFYMILKGRVGVTFEAQGPQKALIPIGQGEFFGEVSLLTGRRRSGTVTASEPSLLIETPRKAMLRLLNTEASVKRALDEVFIVRAFRSYLLPEADPDFLAKLAAKATLCSYKAGEVVFREGDLGDAFYLVRNGSVKVSRIAGQGATAKEWVLNYIPSGRYFGEMALLNPQDPRRNATVTATKYTEAVRLAKADFDVMLAQSPEVEAQMRANVQQRLIAGNLVRLEEEVSGQPINAMMNEGVFEGTDVLLIDENKCVRCDQCVKACAATHGGQTRLYRTEGLIFANLLVPTSCRHCENPLCLTDCQAGDAILRDKNGEVYIRENCIGCGNCAKNCPYGNILMMHEEHRPSNAWDHLLTIIGLHSQTSHDAEPERSKAVKCDLCRDDQKGPACVRICPTGAATRVSPEEYFRKVGVGAF
jgi:putative YpdA family bacillithiol system oxidoreductase